MASLVCTSAVQRGDITFYRLRVILHRHPADNLVTYLDLPHIRPRREIRFQ